MKRTVKLSQLFLSVQSRLHFKEEFRDTENSKIDVGTYFIFAPIEAQKMESDIVKWLLEFNETKIPVRTDGHDEQNNLTRVEKHGGG